MKKYGIIVDLDDCLFNSKLLEKYLPTDPKNQEQWDLYNRQYIQCSLNYHIYEMVKMYVKTHKIIFITSRERAGNVVTVTKTMLNQLFEPKDYEIHMREANDARDSDIVKLELYRKYVKGKYIVKLAVDDDIKNIKMWLREGINTFHCGHTYQQL